MRARVLEAVLALLVEQGFDALSVDAVAERSGVHRTSVYRRWRDVGGLLADVLANAAATGWNPPDTGSVEGDLIAVNHEVHAGLTADPPITTALIAASFRSEPAAQALRAFWADRYERGAVITHRAIARGEVPAGTDPYRLLIAATAPLYHRIVLLREPTSLDEAARFARAAALAAVAGGASGAE